MLSNFCVICDFFPHLVRCPVLVMMMMIMADRDDNSDGDNDAFDDNNTKQ